MKADLIIIINNRIHYFKNGFITEEKDMPFEAGKNYTVREFIQLTPFDKVRLQKDDPAQYDRLKASADKQFSTETDQAAALELAKVKGQVVKEANIKAEIQRTVDLMKFHIKLIEGLLETIPDNLVGSYDPKRISDEEEVLNVPQAIEMIKKVANSDRYIVDMMTSFAEGFRKYRSLTPKQMAVLKNAAKKYNVNLGE